LTLGFGLRHYDHQLIGWYAVISGVEKSLWTASSEIHFRDRAGHEGSFLGAAADDVSGFL
jgi:hypothetical protein